MSLLISRTRNRRIRFVGITATGTITVNAADNVTLKRVNSHNVCMGDKIVTMTQTGITTGKWP